MDPTSCLLKCRTATEGHSDMQRHIAAQQFAADMQDRSHFVSVAAAASVKRSGDDVFVRGEVSGSLVADCFVVIIAPMGERNFQGE